MSEFWIANAIILSCGALAAIGVVAVRYSRDIRAARKRIDSMGSQIIETACGPVECAIVGQGYPVLVVHGAIGGFDQGLLLARNIDVTNHKVISVSRFGYLRTPVPAGATLDTQADAFASLLDTLGIRQAAVFAVSAGTTSALRFAARHPQRLSALVLLSPDAPGEVYMKLPPRFVFDVLFRSDFFFWALITLFKKQIQTAFSLVPEGALLTSQDAALADNVLYSDLPTSLRMDGIVFETYTYEDDFKTFLTPASRFPLNQIQTPALVINAANDPISLPVNVRTLAEQMPNARLYIVPDGGHLLFGHAQEVKAEIDRFLCSNVAGYQNTATAFEGGS
jgi:pimeloyl-ACP methyl ester carboxylesterase